MPHQDQHHKDLQLLEKLHVLLHRLPRIPPKTTKSALLDALSKQPQVIGLSNLRTAIDKNLERLRMLYNMSRYPHEDRWHSEWLPLGLSVAYWEVEGYEYCWGLLDMFLDELGGRVGQLHRNGELRDIGSSTLGDSEPPAPELTPLDEEILKALGDRTLVGKQIAQRMGREGTPDPIKKRLAHLVKTGDLRNKPGRGYSRASKK